MSERTSVYKTRGHNGYASMPDNFTTLEGWSDRALANFLSCSMEVVHRWERTTGHLLAREGPGSAHANPRRHPDPIDPAIIHIHLSHQCAQLSSRYGLGSAWA